MGLFLACYCTYNILVIFAHLQPVPEKHVRLFEVTRDDNNALASKPRKRKHEDADGKTGKEKEETSQPENFKVCRKYQVRWSISTLKILAYPLIYFSSVPILIAINNKLSGLD